MAGLPAPSPPLTARVPDTSRSGFRRSPSIQRESFPARLGPGGHSADHYDQHVSMCSGAFASDESVPGQLYNLTIYFRNVFAGFVTVAMT